MPHSLTIIILAIAILLLLGLTAFAIRFRDKPGVKIFGVLQALSAIWAVFAIVGLQLPRGSLRLQVWGFNTGMSLIVVAVWFAFILSYTGRVHFLTLRRFGVASVPLLIGAGLYFFDPSWPVLVGQVNQSNISAGTVVEASIGPLGAIIGLYIYLVFLAGFLLVIKSALEGNSLFVGQAMALILGSLVTILASVLEIVGIPVTGYPVTEVALIGQSLFWGYAVFGQQFLKIVPAVSKIGERAVFNELDDAVFIIDNNRTVVRANPSVKQHLDLSDIVGESVTPVLDLMGVSTLDDLPTRFEFQGRSYGAKISSINNWQGDHIGQVLIIYDVTSLVRRQQRLEVLNRILRHNVRNSMNVVLGMGDLLQERNDDDLVNIGETIHQQADDLIAISDKALDVDRIFDTGITVERVKLESLVGDVVSPLAAQHPEATINTDISGGEIHTNSKILSLILKEILMNALEHAGDAPEVYVDISRRRDHIEVTVTDDGPGIPQMEIEPIMTGEETDLEHASSLGLWLVKWGVQSLGGSVDIRTTENGTTVILSVPDKEASAKTSSAQQNN